MKSYRTLWDKEQEERRKQNYEKYKGNIHRGDIFYFDKGFVTGVEQQGGRPGIIVSNDACNNSSEFLLVCYLTTQPKTNLPTHIPIVCQQESICLCEQIHTLSKEKLQNYYCTASQKEMAEIDKALIITLGIDLNNVLPKDYNKILEELKEKEERIALLEANLEAKNKEIEKQLSYNSKLIDEIQKLKRQNISVENTPEYIRVCTERDVYIKLYNDLLQQK